MDSSLLEVGAGVAVTSTSDTDLHVVGRGRLEDVGDVHFGVGDDDDGGPGGAGGVHHLPPVLVLGTGGEDDLS